MLSICQIYSAPGARFEQGMLMMAAKRIVTGTALLLVAALAVLFVCLPLPMVNTAKQKVETNKEALNFRITWKGYSGRGEAIAKIVDAYNQAQNPGSAIVMENGDEDIDSIKTLLESNSQTVFVLPYRFVKYFGGKGLLMDLTASFQDTQALFYPKIWKLGMVGNTVYGVPWLGHSMCLLYNKTLLEKAGVDAAAINSLDALVNALSMVEAQTDARGIGLVGLDSNDVSWMVNQFIYGFGSKLVSDDGKTVAVNNDKAKAALSFYRDVLGEHAQPAWHDDTGLEVMAHFRNQEVAFEIQGIWGVTDIQKNGSPFEVGIIDLKDIGLCAEVGPMMLALPAGLDSETAKEAFKFIRYLISNPAQEMIMKGEYSPEHDAYYPFRTPIRIDMADSLKFHDQPEYTAFIEGFESPSTDVPVPLWQAVKDEIYEPGLSSVMRGDMTIEDFLTAVETKGNKILGGQNPD
jgi:multiple sugar transport system substrate-binding protein